MNEQRKAIRIMQEYIRRLKLSKSALKLRDEKCQILDIAMGMGFGSVDGYQRAFRCEFGCNPKEYSGSPIPIWLFTPYYVSSEERTVRDMSEVRNIFIQIIELPAATYLLFRGEPFEESYFDICAEVDIM